MVLKRAWRGPGGRAKQAAPQPRRARPRVEELENRLVPTNFFVSTLGADAAGRGSSAAPFRSLQFAVDQASSGDRIHVATGTYTYFDNRGSSDQSANALGVQAVVTIANKQLEVFGGFSNDFSQLNPSAFPTVITGNDVVRCVYVVASAPGNNPSVLMDGFTIQNGLARGLAPRGVGLDQSFAFGGGMWINMSANPNAGPFVLRNLTFQNNRSIGSDTGGVGGTGAGGGLALRFVGNLTLQQVRFVGNLAQGGSGPSQGGGAVGGAIHSDNSRWT